MNQELQQLENKIRTLQDEVRKFTDEERRERERTHDAINRIQKDEERHMLRIKRQATMVNKEILALEIKRRELQAKAERELGKIRP